MELAQFFAVTVTAHVNARFHALARVLALFLNAAKSRIKALAVTVLVQMLALDIAHFERPMFAAMLV